MLPVRWSPAAAVAAVCLVSACDASPRPAAELSLAVSPLTLPGLTEAVYDVRVARGTPDAAHGVDSDAPAATVWARTLSSTAYGGPAGALSYVGPCDADDQDPATAGSQAPNTVYLVLAGLTADAPLVDGVDFINPCPAAAPCAQTAPCVENADTPVSFDLTVMRAARQGFFDVAVTFDDLFCSGKVDCAPALLHGPDGERARTTVLAFACTSGLDLDLDPANDTRLFANDLVVSCANGAAPDTVAVLDLAAPAGRHLSTDPTSPVSTWALYAGTEPLDGYRKGYWNLSLVLAPGASDCTLRGAATASSAPWPDGRSPAHAAYPVLAFDDVDLGTAGGACHPAHPLDAPGSAVHTTYTPLAAAGPCFGNVGTVTATSLDRADAPCAQLDPCADAQGGCAPAPCLDAGGVAWCGPCPVGYDDGGASGCTPLEDITLAFASPTLELFTGATAPATVVPLTDALPSHFPTPALTATLTSSDPACVSVPATLLLNPVFPTASFTVTALATPCTATVTVTDPRLGTDTLAVTVHPQPDLGPFSFASDAEFRVGASLQAPMTVSLPVGRPAHGPLSFTVSSSDPAHLQLSPSSTGASAASLTLTLSNAADTGASFYVRGVPGHVGATSTLTATHLRADPGSATVTVAPHIFRLTNLYPSRTVSSASASSDDGFTVYTGVALADGSWKPQNVSWDLPGLDVTLSASGNGSARIVTPSTASQTGVITIPALTYVHNLLEVPSQLGLRLITNPTPGTYTVTASTADSDPAYPDTSRAVTVAVATSTITLADPSATGRLGVGLQQPYTLTLTSGHPAVTVTLTSADPARVRLSSAPTTAGASDGTLAVAFASNENTKTIYVQSVAGAATGALNLHATAPGFVERDQLVTLVAPVLEITDETITTSSGNAYTDITDDAFRVDTGIANPSNPAVRVAQTVSAAAGPLTVTVTKTPSAAATLIGPSGSGDTVTGTVAVNASQSPATVAAGGFAVNFAYPAVTGTFSYTATAPGVSPFGPATVSVSLTMTPATLTFAASGNGGDYVGGGLQNYHTVNLSTSSHPPLTLRVSSSDPSKVLVTTSAGATTANPSHNFTIGSGTGSFTFYVHGVAGAVGSTTLSITCVAGDCFFPTLTKVVSAVPVEPVFGSVGATLATTALEGEADAYFHVSLFIRNASNALVTQTVAGTGAPFPIDLEILSGLDDHVTLWDQTHAVEGRSLTYTVAAGQSTTPTTQNALFLRYAPNIPAGTHTVRVRAKTPGTAPSGSATVTQTISSYQAYLTTVFGSYNRLAVGLVDSFTLRLNADNSPVTIGQHGGVTVHLAHAARPCLGTTATTTSSSELDVYFPNGTVTQTIYLLGCGTNSVTATAPHATSATLNVPSFPASAQFRTGATVRTTDTFTAATTSKTYGLRIGVVDAGGTFRLQTAPSGGYPVGLSAAEHGSVGTHDPYQAWFAAGTHTIESSLPAVTVYRLAAGTYHLVADPGLQGTNFAPLTITMQ